MQFFKRMDVAEHTFRSGCGTAVTVTCMSSVYRRICSQGRQCFPLALATCSACLYLLKCFGAEALLLLFVFFSFFYSLCFLLHPFPAVFCSFPFPQLAYINACIMVERSTCVVYIKNQLLVLFHYHDGWNTRCSDQVSNKAYALVCCLLMHSMTIQLRPRHSVWDLSVIRLCGDVPLMRGVFGSSRAFFNMFRIHVLVNLKRIRKHVECLT